jgi:nucleotide-binding universal stress UspA family protein
MKKILVPCDFSESALQAYHFAMNLAAQANAEVFVLKVIDLPFIYENAFGSSPEYFDPGTIKYLEEDAKNNFEKMKNKHVRKERVSFITLRGSVTFTISQFALDNKIDLIVMGTKGASGLKEYWIGSNTEKVVRFSPVPVLTVRKSFDLSTIKNIVSPTMLKLDQGDLIMKLKELQSFFSAKIHLLLVNTPGNMLRTADEMDLMEKFAKQYKLENYTLNTRNDFSVQDGIMNFAHEIKADMIAMGTHGRRGLSHMFMGSVTEDIVNHVDCPIWTYLFREQESSRLAWY